MSEQVERPTVDDEFIRRALAGCNHNALRMALFHQTGDPRLSTMEVITTEVFGGALTPCRLDRHHHGELQDMAEAELHWACEEPSLGSICSPPARSSRTTWR